MSSLKSKIVFALVLSGLLSTVGWYEVRLNQAKKNFKTELQIKERYIEKILEDAVKMEKEILAYRFDRSRPFQHDLNSEEFLEVMADYLSKDGRCVVKIHKIDWSTWAEKYGG